MTDLSQIHEINSKAQWETFLSNQSPNSFLQSWNWGETQKQNGHKILRLGIFDQHKTLKGVALTILIKAKRGFFFHIPYGPVINWHETDLFNALISYLISIAKKKKASFIRISPLIDDTKSYRKIFQAHGFKDAPVHLVNPELSWLKDLENDIDQIFQNLKKETRYEIRRAEKLGVKIFKSHKLEALERFYQIHLETVQRHHFIPYSFDFLKNQLTSFSPDNQIEIFEAIFQDKVISSAIIMFYGKEASYHHAASLTEFQKIPASYLIQWEVIKEAVKRKCVCYNFWGIVENKPKHPWHGLSLFKKKFGGYPQKYLHVQDLPLSWKYALTWLLETIRKYRRGY